MEGAGVGDLTAQTWLSLISNPCPVCNKFPQSKLFSKVDTFENERMQN